MAFRDYIAELRSKCSSSHRTSNDENQKKKKLSYSIRTVQVYSTRHMFHHASTLSFYTSLATRRNKKGTASAYLSFCLFCFLKRQRQCQGLMARTLASSSYRCWSSAQGRRSFARAELCQLLTHSLVLRREASHGVTRTRRGGA